jgi:hypothetical protein
MMRVIFASLVLTLFSLIATAQVANPCVNRLVLLLSVLHPPSLFRCTQNGDGVVSISPPPFGHVWPTSMQK